MIEQPITIRLDSTEEGRTSYVSGYETTLDILLRYLGARTLIFAGIAGNICILFSANDAYMRDFHLIVPADCTVSNTAEENEHALEEIRIVLKADITLSSKLLT